MDKKAKIFVAGHTGLLGSSLFRLLRAEGFVNILARNHSELDLTDRKNVRRFFEQEKPDFVFLAAGLTGGILANKSFPADFFHTNILIQDNVFEAANKYEAKQVVFYGSSCMYPVNSLQTMTEEALLTGKIEQTSEGYAAAKIAGIFACRAYNNQYKTNRFIALVPNSMFGPGDNFNPDNSHVISSLIMKFHNAKINQGDSVVLWGSGNPRREFIFVDDVAVASLFAVTNSDRINNHHYNIGTGVDYSIRELAQMIADIVGFKGEIKWDDTQPDGAPRKILDSSKIRSLGWEHKVGIADGIRATYLWFSKN